MRVPMISRLFVLALALAIGAGAQAAEQLRKADIEAALNAAYDKYKSLQEGANADYIPALAKVDSNIFGIALVTTALAFGLLEIALAAAAKFEAPPLVAMALMVGVGFTMTSTMTQANTTVQTNTPDAMRGRVMSIYLTVFAGGTPIGDALAGAFSQNWGVAVAIAIGGAVVAAVAVLISRQLARAERHVPDPALT